MIELGYFSYFSIQHHHPRGKKTMSCHNYNFSFYRINEKMRINETTYARRKRNDHACNIFLLLILFSFINFFFIDKCVYMTFDLRDYNPIQLEWLTNDAMWFWVLYIFLCLNSFEHFLYIKGPIKLRVIFNLLWDIY